MIKAAGHEVVKMQHTIRGNVVYRVNGVEMTKDAMIEAFKRGEL